MEHRFRDEGHAVIVPDPNDDLAERNARAMWSGLAALPIPKRRGPALIVLALVILFAVGIPLGFVVAGIQR